MNATQDVIGNLHQKIPIDMDRFNNSLDENQRTTPQNPSVAPYINAILNPTN